MWDRVTVTVVVLGAGLAALAAAAEHLLRRPRRRRLSDRDVPAVRQAAIDGATSAARYASFDAAWLDYQAVRVLEEGTSAMTADRRLFFEAGFRGGRSIVQQFDAAGVPWQDALTARVASIEEAESAEDVFVVSLRRPTLAPARHLAAGIT